MKNNISGYINLRQFNGSTLSSTLQNLVMRDFCIKNGFTFNISPSEFIFNNSYTQLNSLLNSKSISGVVMCSIFMLPKNIKERLKLYKLANKNKKKMYFVFEKISVLKLKDFNQIEELFFMRSIFKKNSDKILDKKYQKNLKVQKKWSFC
tara:strand:+ start:876 stop:1325 length:450 start_codon:yes stop_codon:yes gene_type:complete